MLYYLFRDNFEKVAYILFKINNEKLKMIKGFLLNYKSMYTRLWRIDICLSLIFLIVAIFIPAWYQWHAQIPDEKELNISSGFYVSDYKGKGKYLDGIRTDSGVFYFNCSTGFYFDSNRSCIRSYEIKKFAKNIKSEAIWFDLPTYIFGGSNKYLVRLVVGEREVLSISESRDRIERANSVAVSGSICMALVFLFIYLVIVPAIIKQKAKK